MSSQQEAGGEAGSASVRKGRRVEVHRPNAFLDALMTGLFVAEIAWAVFVNSGVREGAMGSVTRSASAALCTEPRAPDAIFLSSWRVFYFWVCACVHSGTPAVGMRPPLPVERRLIR